MNIQMKTIDNAPPHPWELLELTDALKEKNEDGLRLNWIHLRFLTKNYKLLQY